MTMSSSPESKRVGQTTAPSSAGARVRAASSRARNSRLVEAGIRLIDVAIEQMQGRLLAGHARAAGDVDVLPPELTARLFAQLTPILKALAPGLGLIEAGRIDASRGGGKHKGAQFSFALHGILEGRPTAHGLGDDCHLGKAKMIDEGGEVLGVVAGVGPTGNRRRWGEAAVGKGHAGIARGKVRDLLPPGGVIAAKAVRKHDRATLAGDFPIKATARPRQRAAPPHCHGLRLAQAALCQWVNCQVGAAAHGLRTWRPSLPCW